jgi:hypothetical protein
MSGASGAGGGGGGGGHGGPGGGHGHGRVRSTWPVPSGWSRALPLSRLTLEERAKRVELSSVRFRGLALFAMPLLATAPSANRVVMQLTGHMYAQPLQILCAGPETQVY